MIRDNVLVTGGAGYVGSHACVSLWEAGYWPVIFDNFSNSSPRVLDRMAQITGEKFTLIEGDISNISQVNSIFRQKSIAAVMHFAGLKAVKKSMQNPLEYYRINVGGSINILEGMKHAGVKSLVFSSSATIYGNPKSNPIAESSSFAPVNPYGQSKRFVEEIISDLFSSDTSFNFAKLRYFNPVGAHKTGLIGEDPNEAPQNLMPYLAQVAIGRLSKLEVFGRDYPTKDGTGVRDYIHVMDVADAHVAALKYLCNNGGKFAVNIGTGKGVSVLDLILAFEKASGRKIPWIYSPRREGDVPEYYADPTLAKQKLGWKPKRCLDEMCSDMWRWQLNNPDGY